MLISKKIYVAITISSVVSSLNYASDLTWTEINTFPVQQNWSTKENNMGLRFSTENANTPSLDSNSYFNIQNGKEYTISGYDRVEFTNNDPHKFNTSLASYILSKQNSSITIENTRDVIFGTSKNNRNQSKYITRNYGKQDYGKINNPLNSFIIYGEEYGISSLSSSWTNEITNAKQHSTTNIFANNVFINTKKAAVTISLAPEDTANATENQAEINLIGRKIDITSTSESAIQVYNNEPRSNDSRTAIINISGIDDINIVSEAGSKAAIGLHSGFLYKTIINLSSENKIKVKGNERGIWLQAARGSIVTLQAPTIELIANDKWNGIAFDSYESITFIGSNITVKGKTALLTDGKTTFKSMNANEKTFVSLVGDVIDNGIIEMGNATISTDESSRIWMGGALTATDGYTGTNTLLIGNGHADANTVKYNAIDGLRVELAGSATDIVVPRYGSAQNVVENLKEYDPNKDVNDVIQISGKPYILVSAHEGKIQNGFKVNYNTEGSIASVTVMKHRKLGAFNAFNANTFISWRNQANPLHERLGTLRDTHHMIGTWARVYGSEREYSDAVKLNVKDNTIQIGTDVNLEGWILGGAFSYTSADAMISNGSGKSNTYALAAYATRYFEYGGYIDVIGRVGQITADVHSFDERYSFVGNIKNIAYGISMRRATVGT